MCLILVAHGFHPEYRQVVAANRDEFHARPTTPAAPWSDAPDVVAGRDLREGGTWMGAHRDGRWGAVTNVRDFREPVFEGAPSRGALVADYLRGSLGPAEFLADLADRADEFNGFNLLLGDAESLWWFSNRSGEPPRELAPGVYGLSNHLLDTDWPKVARGRAALRAELERPGGPDPRRLFAILSDRSIASDTDLPDTGAGRAMERVLSPAFIADDEYGTRASTVLLLDSAGHGRLLERTFGPGGRLEGEAEYGW